jgi:HK97 family phage major capsid protein
MTQQEIERRKKRDEKFWNSKLEFKDNEEFLRAVIRHFSDPSIDEITVDPRIERAASGLDSDGIEVGEKFMYDLMNGPKSSELYKRATKYTLGSYGSLRLPAVDEQTRTNSQYGGARTYYEAEADEIDFSTAKYRQIHLQTKKLITASYLTDELIAEGLEDYCFNTLSVANARRLTSAIVGDTGAGQFLGILNAGATITIDAEGGQTSGFSVENASKMVARLPEESHHNLTCWLIQPELYSELMQQAFYGQTTSAPLITWRRGGEKFNKMLGFDILPCEACSAQNSRGDVILCDPTQYLIAEKRIKKTISGHVRFIYGESILRLVLRADGAPAWSQPVIPENSTTSVSPFITLATRS